MRASLNRAVAVGLLLTFSGVGCLNGTDRGPCAKTTPIATICGFHNPEDLEYVGEAGLLLVSDMRRGNVGGFISSLQPGSDSPRVLWPAGSAGDIAEQPELGDESCPGPPNRGAFYPHGLTSARRGDQEIIYVVAHAGESGGREAVEVFRLIGKGKAAVLSWAACIPTPSAVQGNDVAAAPDGSLVVANYQPNDSLANMISAVLLGRSSGDIIVWSPDSGWRHLRDSEALMANGVAVSADGRMVFYTETGNGRVHRRPLTAKGPDVHISIPGKPDNLTWDRDGKLLVATHTSGLRFALCLFGQHPCESPWATYEVDPVTLATRKILEHNGHFIGAVATTLQVGDNLYFGSVFDDRIGVVPVQEHD